MGAVLAVMGTELHLASLGGPMASIEAMERGGRSGGRCFNPFGIASCRIVSHAAVIADGRGPNPQQER